MRSLLVNVGLSDAIAAGASRGAIQALECGGTHCGGLSGRGARVPRGLHDRAGCVCWMMSHVPIRDTKEGGGAARGSQQLGGGRVPRNPLGCHRLLSRAIQKPRRTGGGCASDARGGRPVLAYAMLRTACLVVLLLAASCLAATYQVNVTAGGFVPQRLAVFDGDIVVWTWALGAGWYALRAVRPEKSR